MQSLRYIPFNNIIMDFLSGQKEPFYHRNDTFDDFPDRKTGISFRLG